MSGTSTAENIGIALLCLPLLAGIGWLIWEKIRDRREELTYRSELAARRQQRDEVRAYVPEFAQPLAKGKMRS